MQCELCGSGDLRFVAVESREPHGEMCRDEGYRCTKCGATQMAAVEPIISQTPDQLIAALMRSIILAQNLEPAFRLGVALATPRKPAANVNVGIKVEVA